MCIFKSQNILCQMNLTFSLLGIWRQWLSIPSTMLLGSLFVSHWRHTSAISWCLSIYWEALWTGPFHPRPGVAELWACIAQARVLIAGGVLPCAPAATECDVQRAAQISSHSKQLCSKPSIPSPPNLLSPCRGAYCVCSSLTSLCTHPLRGMSDCPVYTSL